MDIRKLQRVIVDGLEDVKAQNIAVFNTEHLSALFERVIIASGTSNRQTKSLASSVREAVKGAGFAAPRTEGETHGEWIIVDCGAAVVHVMQPSIREYYHLEELWGDKPVNMKLADGTRKLVKASEPELARSTAARKGAARTAVASAPRAKAPAATIKTAAGEKTAAKRVAAKAVGAKKVAAKKIAAKSVVTRTVGSKRVAPRTIVVNAPVARKSAAKKSPGIAARARKPASR